jgi:hypothetical protein
MIALSFGHGYDLDQNRSKVLEGGMDRAIVVRGKLSDPSHIELDEPVSGINGPVEVTVRPVQTAKPRSPQ